MRTSISFFPNTSKKSSKTGKIPLYLRIIHNGQKAEARLNEEITQEELPKWNPFVMRLDVRGSQLNSKLNAMSKSYDDFKILNGSRLHLFDAKKVRDILVGDDGGEDPRVHDYATKYYQKAVSANTTLSVGTRKNYLKALKHLTNFMRISKRESVTLSSLNAQFVTEFWDYLLSTFPEHKKKGMSEVSASGIFKKFRTIFDRAVSENHIARNPFRVIKLKTKSAFRQRLTSAEVAAWYNCELDRFPALILYKDIFTFSCFTGLAYSDVMELEWSHLYATANGELVLRKKRHKTGEHTEVVLTAVARAVLMKYKSHPETCGSQRIFPMRSLTALNYHNKIIADKIGIVTKVTTHVARHTFRQLIADACIEDESVIRRMMGQSRGNSIDAVYYEVTESRLLNAKCKFESFLKDVLGKEMTSRN